MQHPDTRTADARDTAKATAYLTDSPLAGLGSWLHRNLVLRFSLGSQVAKGPGAVGQGFPLYLQPLKEHP